MYFPVGLPRVFAPSPLAEDVVSDAVVFLALSPTRRYIAAVTPNGVLLWSSGSHQIVLGYYENIPRSATANEADGAYVGNVDACWGDEDRYLAVSNTLGVLQILTITPTQSVPFTLNIPSSHAACARNGELPCSLAAVMIEPYHTFLPPNGGAAAMQACGGFLLVLTQEGLLLVVSWRGEVMEQVGVETLIPACAGDGGRGVVHMHLHLPFLVLTFDDGRAVVLKHSGNAQSLMGINLSLFEEKLHCGAGVTCTAVNLRFNVVALGLESGEVLIHSLLDPGVAAAEEGSSMEGRASEPFDQGTSFERLISMVHWDVSAEVTGRVHLLQWAPDGCALAIGWGERGVSVWSRYGCRLMCSIPQLGAASVEGRGCGGERLELMRNGVSAMTWGEGGYQLFMCGNAPEYGGDSQNKLVAPSSLISVRFVKSALACNPTVNYSGRLLLQGDDHLLMMRKHGRQLNNITWKKAPIPQSYIRENWPVRLVSVNRKGRHVAVAGRRGFCVFNSNTQRWSSFSKRSEEQSLECGCMCWYKNYVIISNQSDRASPQLVAFPRQRLAIDSNVLAHSIPRGSLPVFMDCNDSHLVVFTADGFLYQYDVIPVMKEGTTRVARLDIKLLHGVALAGISPENFVSLLLLGRDGPVASMAAIPELSSPAAVDIGKSPTDAAPKESTNCLLLDVKGTLSVSSLENALRVGFASNVEQFWFGGDKKRGKGVHHLANSLWAYGELGLQVWYPFLSHETDLQSLRIMSRDQSLDFDAEVYPIGFVAELGVIIGLSQAIDHSSPSYPCFRLQTKTHPFLHCMLRSLIEKGDAEEATEVAYQYSSIPHFTHSLELLLHSVLEDEEFGRVDSDVQKHALRRVLRFLRQFSQFPEVVVRCARKTDVLLWPKLFSFAGHPRELFCECLEQNQIETAASFLRVLLNLDGPDIACQSACTLLETVLDADHLGMVSDILRFLESVQLSRSGDPDNRFIPDVLLSQYAQRLLAQRQLRALVTFSLHVNKPMREWISAATNSLCADEFGDALVLIHQQFCIEYPAEQRFIPADATEPGERAHSATNLSALHSRYLELGERDRRNATTWVSVPGVESPNWHACMELEVLLKEMIETECTSWSLVIATALLQVSLILEILLHDDDGSLCRAYAKLLADQQECVGYDNLHHFVKENVAQFPRTAEREL